MSHTKTRPGHRIPFYRIEFAQVVKTNLLGSGTSRETWNFHGKSLVMTWNSKANPVINGWMFGWFPSISHVKILFIIQLKQPFINWLALEFQGVQKVLIEIRFEKRWEILNIWRSKDFNSFSTLKLLSTEIDKSSECNPLNRQKPHKTWEMNRIDKWKQWE